MTQLPAGSSMSCIRMLRPLAAGVTVSTAAFTTAPISITRRSRRSLPVMMRETSSSSSMIWLWEVALRRMVSMARLASSGGSRPQLEQVSPSR